LGFVTGKMRNHGFKIPVVNRRGDTVRNLVLLPTLHLFGHIGERVLVPVVPHFAVFVFKQWFYSREFALDLAGFFG
jgi:hypothetical protein